ncbi:MAG: toprim domain-containing protein [Patescibacteria group bacterium]|nr:toprim domain-containing protein [Patescibacteria group bacterium]MCL5432004.1 toprim domain-containing protein [Patescibacteria group bacterium]
MQELQTITIKEYLSRKGVAFRESGKELIVKCLFNNCDKDSQSNEAHLYFDSETGQYECKKCGEKGNLITLAKHLGDDINEIALNPRVSAVKPRSAKFGAVSADACHLALTPDIRKYLNARGISDPVVDAFKLGWGKFYGKYWITIPIKDIYGSFCFFKLRQDPNTGNDKMTYPKGIEAQIYGWEMLSENHDRIIICEGELDRLALISRNIPAITSTHGALTFKKEWVDKIGKGKKIYICYDNDEAGRKGSERVAKLLENSGNEIFIVTLPNEVGEGGDITDYLVKLNGDPEDLFSKYAKPYPEKIDTSQFKPLSAKKIIETLGLTIKRDEENKLITFLCELSAYTKNSQLNISFNAPSSTGKSYIPTEIARLFPEDDIVEVGYCSPTAFFHDVGEYDKERNGYLVDLSRKILIFLDQPHTLLLQHLRPLLSHDKKEIRLKITDKSQKAGLRTKNIFLRGFPAVIFCTAGLTADEQETTRFMLLSPETNQEKIRQAIYEKIKKETDSEKYENVLEENLERQSLKERIKAIKLENIQGIKIGSPEELEKMFFGQNKMLKPRHQRDIGRIISLVKAFALLNLWFRQREGSIIVANSDDITEAFNVWDTISESQELNLPPYVYKLFQEIIIPAWNEKNQGRDEFEKITGQLGLTRREIQRKHILVYGRTLADWLLRQHMIPLLESAGLICQEPDPSDKRKMLIYPTTPLGNSATQNNSEPNGGVEEKLNI